MSAVWFGMLNVDADKRNFYTHTGWTQRLKTVFFSGWKNKQMGGDAFYSVMSQFEQILYPHQ
jgi:hypothetical protein